MRGWKRGTQRVSANRKVTTFTARLALAAIVVLAIDGAAVAPAAGVATTPPATVAGQEQSGQQSAAGSVATGSVATGDATVATTAATVTQSSVTTTRYQETSSRFTYSGTWRPATSSSYLGGRVSYSRQKGAAATFRFTGIGVSWIGPTGPTRGSARVYVNGVYRKTVSLYSRTFVARRTLLSLSWTAQRARTLKIVVVGTSGRPTVAIDAMSVRAVSTSSATTPSPTLRPSGPIFVSQDNVTIDGVSISSSGKTGSAIVVYGTPSRPLHNVTIRNCQIKGFSMGIEAKHVENLIIDHCTITDADYAGIAVYSGVGGRITSNTIRRIGYTRTNLTGGFQNNAYGITLDHYAFSNLTADPYSSDFYVGGNLVEDVPLWHGLDTHAGQRITFASNVIRRCARAIFITGDGTQVNHPRAVTVTGNRLEQAVTKTGGTQKIAITLVNLQGGAVTNNAISTTYPSPRIFDYLGLDPAGSVNVTISGNTTIP